MMVQIIIQCPSCNKRGNVDIDENVITKNIRGITAVDIGAEIVCKHSLIAYIDRNKQVRDCFTADFIVTIPEIKIKKQKEVSIPNQDNVDIFLLTMNLNGKWIAYVIRACLHDKKVLILNDLNILNNHILNFFEYLFKNTFDISISLIERKTYKHEKKKYKDHVILDLKKVIQDKSKILRDKLMKIENLFIQKFFKEENPESSLLILRNEIVKAHELAKSVHEYIQDQGENKPLNRKEVNKFIELKYKNVKIDAWYLNFIVSIVKDWYDVKIIDTSHKLDIL